MRRYAPVVLVAYWAVLAAATHYPTVPLPEEVSARDKALHFGAFAVLALLFWYALAARTAATARTVWIAAAVLIPYAAIDEYTQGFVGRHRDLADWIANVAGILCALGALELHRRCALRRE